MRRLVTLCPSSSRKQGEMNAGVQITSSFLLRLGSQFVASGNTLIDKPRVVLAKKF